MPEQITKHPEVTMQVLESAGAQCAKGVKPRILTQCPAEQFCALPGGEVCIYGIGQIPRMTQISPAELGRVVCPEAGAAEVTTGLLASADAIALSGVFVLGLVAGRFWKRHGRKGPP